MRTRDTSDVLASAAAVLADAAAVFGGFLLATWLRFDSGLIPMRHDVPPPNLYALYGWGAAVGTLMFLFIFQQLHLYARPQDGFFSSKIPRLIRAVAIGILLAAALGFALRTDPPFSRMTVVIAFFTIGMLVLIERALLFRLEILLARRSGARTRVLIVGCNSIAVRLWRALEQDPRLRYRVVGFCAVDDGEPLASEIPAERICGTVDALESIIEREPVDQLSVTSSEIPQARLVKIILACERQLVDFCMVPDIMHVLTGAMDVRMIGDIPLLGIGRWPLDRFWNRCLKRGEDIVGAVVGLALFAPVIAVAGLLIRLTSEGPVFFRQERCGHNGRPFTMVKLRTMRNDAEMETGPVWTVADDARRTRIGAWLRCWNIDELPQLWNVLKGNMSLVGPRPERPFFVQQFREDIGGYMWRHVSRPGMTGWAQVNGLRGNTSIEERVRYDLYYLEHWSPAFDFKILLRTLFKRENAY